MRASHYLDGLCTAKVPVCHRAAVSRTCLVPGCGSAFRTGRKMTQTAALRFMDWQVGYDIVSAGIIYRSCITVAEYSQEE